MSAGGKTVEQLKKEVAQEYQSFKPAIEAAATALTGFNQNITTVVVKGVQPQINDLANLWRSDARIALTNKYNESIVHLPDMENVVADAAKTLQSLARSIENHNNLVQAIEVDDPSSLFNRIELGIPVVGAWAQMLTRGPTEEEAQGQVQKLIDEMMKDYDTATTTILKIPPVVWHGKQAVDQAPGTPGAPAGSPGSHPPGTGSSDQKGAKPPGTPQQPGAKQASNPAAADAGKSMAGAQAKTPAGSGASPDPGTGSSAPSADSMPMLASAAPPMDLPTASAAPKDPFLPALSTSHTSPPLQIPPLTPAKFATLAGNGVPVSTLGTSGPTSSTNTQLPRSVSSAARESGLSAPASASAGTAAAGRGGPPFYPPPMGGAGGMGANKQGGGGVKPGVAQSPGGPKVGQPGAGKRKPKNVGIPPDLLGREGEQVPGDRRAGPSSRRRGKPKLVPSEVLDEELWNVDTPATSDR